MPQHDIDELIASVRQRTTLRDLADTIAAQNNCYLKDLTALSNNTDPYRVGEHCREDAEWFARKFYELVPDQTTRVHLRGLHYRLVATNAIKPNGNLYAGTLAEDDQEEGTAHKDWTWLQTEASKAARWLGYVQFERITDERNGEPIIRLIQPPPLRPSARLEGILDDLVEFENLLPDLDEFVPSVTEWLGNPELPEFNVSSFSRRQPYRIALVGEKSSLEEVLGPLSARYDTELILPSGEATDTLIFEAAQRAAADDRPTVVLYFSDFDPSGWQMPISFGRKLQALRDFRFGDLNAQVHRIALTFQQVKEFDLPASPLKKKELRADHWKERWGHEQTEIDALAALRPDILTKIAEDAIKKFYDNTLASRLRRAREDWLTEAQARLHAHPKYAALKQALEDARRNTAAVLTDIRTTVKGVIATALDEVHPELAEKYQTASDAYDQLQQVYEEATEELSQVEPPDIIVPVPEIDESAHDASRVFDSNDDWLSATHKMISIKNLNGVEGTKLRRARL